MTDRLRERILKHIAAEGYTPQNPKVLAHVLNAIEEEEPDTFRSVLRELMDEGRVVVGSSGSIVLPGSKIAKDEFLGTYRHNRRGFGFVVPTDPQSHEDLFIPPGENKTALTGDIVRAKITRRGMKDGKAIVDGMILEVVERKNVRFPGTLAKVEDKWVVQPDGNAYTDPILTPDAAGRHIAVGTKVVVEITNFPDADRRLAQGVITRVLGQEGEPNVDLQAVVALFGLPEEFPDAVADNATEMVQTFRVQEELGRRLDLTKAVICTIDPPDAKDYDDAISLEHNDDGTITLGVHIADVSHFVKAGSPLDEEARERGNSTYFPGHVIPMLPEVLSNGVCSLQEGVPRFAKSAFITLDKNAKPVATAFSNSVIESAVRFRYIEAQAIIDGLDVVPHPTGDRTIADYPPHVVKLLRDMNDLAKRIQKRRQAAGQLNLSLPDVDLVLDETGKVIDAKQEDDSFTHTLIEMFMVEANEAVARLLNRINTPFLRRTHPEPDMDDHNKLSSFAMVCGHKLPDTLDRHVLQALLAKVKGRPEEFAINLAVLKTFTRAEYSPKKLGHFALASEDYCHFTSPIRRYADLTVHRSMDAWFDHVKADFSNGPLPAPKGDVALKGQPTEADLTQLGEHLSYTERRSEDAERELRKVKILELLTNHVGDETNGVITGMANFGIFVQLETWLLEGLVRYEDLLDDWWSVDVKGGVIRGERSGQQIRIGDVVTVIIGGVDVARRDLTLAVTKVISRGSNSKTLVAPGQKPKPAGAPNKGKTGQQGRDQRSKQRDRAKTHHRRDKKA